MTPALPSQRQGADAPAVPIDTLAGTPAAPPASPSPAAAPPHPVASTTPTTSATPSRPARPDSARAARPPHPRFSASAPTPAEPRDDAREADVRGTVNAEDADEAAVVVTSAPDSVSPVSQVSPDVVVTPVTPAALVTPATPSTPDDAPRAQGTPETSEAPESRAAQEPREPGAPSEPGDPDESRENTGFGAAREASVAPTSRPSRTRALLRGVRRGRGNRAGSPAEGAPENLPENSSGSSTGSPAAASAGTPAKAPAGAPEVQELPPSMPPRAATSPVGIPRIGVTTVAPRGSASSAAASSSRSSTLLVDSAALRLRRTEDLLDLVVNVLGIGSMIVLATFARQTTTGVTQDVQNVLAVVLRQILVMPLQAVEGLIAFVIPVAVILPRLLSRAWRVVAGALLAGIGALVLAWTVLVVVQTWAPGPLVAGLSVMIEGASRVGISTVLAVLAGLLTGIGERRTSHTVRHAWTALWIAVGLAVLRSALTLPGAILSVLLGRVPGLVVRYVLGVEDHRAHGITLVRALRRAGIDAARVVRMDHAPGARAWTVETDTPLGYTEQVRENPLAVPAALPDVGEDGKVVGDLPPAEPSDRPVEDAAAPAPEYASTIVPALDVDVPAVLAEASSAALSDNRLSAHRLYAVWDVRGVRHDVTVLDADRQFAGFLSTIWDRIRIKGLSPERDLSVRAAAEHAALMTLEARRARVRTPELFGMAEAGESVLLVTDHVVGARTLGELERIPDDVLVQLWEQLARAHAAGIAHRAVDSSSVVVDVAYRVWLLDWDSGETISSELSRRVDLAQTLALMASLVGVERAIAAASRSLSTQQLASIAPMLQRVVLPASTRYALGRRGKLLQELRDALVELTPMAHAEPAKLTRISVKSVLTAVIFVAVGAVMAQMNLEQIVAAVRQANIWWILGALLFSLLTYVGAGLSLVALSPVRLSLWTSTKVHLASSVVSLVAPAGVGGAAINLRFLNRKGVPAAVGVATVALVQVVQFLVTLVLLVVLAAVTRQSTGLTLPSGWLVVGAIVLMALFGSTLLLPRVRTWLWQKVEPTYRQVWPRLVWILSNPLRLSLGVGATVLLSLSYILAFASSLWAFGYTLPFSVLAITYLASNTVGSVIPSPGGIGPVELALTGGLAAAGIPGGVALSAAIVYRLVTFWIPVPAGWLCLQRLQKTGDM